MGRTCKYTKNDNYFSNPNLDNSYWAGFLAADGTISIYRNRYQLNCEIATVDLDHLLKLKTVLEYTGPLLSTTHQSGFSSKSAVKLCINSAKKLISDLKTNFNIIEKKSLVLIPPTHLIEECQLAFIKGYIDGDGSIYKLRNSLALGIVGTQDVLIWIKNKCDKISPKLKPAEVKKFPHSNIYQYQLGFNRAVKFLSILSSLETSQLTRKWNILKEFTPQ